MYHYQADIDLSFCLEEMESGEDSWMVKFTALEEDHNFCNNMSDYVVWDFNNTLISNVKVISKIAKFSDTPGLIDVSAKISFDLNEKYEDMDEEKSDDYTWEVKNGITINYSSDDNDYDFLSQLDDIQVSIHKV